MLNFFNLPKTIYGSNGNDNPIGGTQGKDNIYGLGGDDRLFGFGGDDRLYGGSGNDVLNGNEGDDVVFGEDGDDRLYGDGFGPADQLGDATPLGEGNDTLYGGDGNDWLYGGKGQDTAYGGNGNDHFEDHAGPDHYDGGAGTDTLWLTGISGQGSIVDLGVGGGYAGDAAGDTYAGIENVKGSDYADQIYGDGGVNLLDGSSGNDKLVGRGGADVLIGGWGHDRLEGGAGADTLIGGHTYGGGYTPDTGTDTAVYVNSSQGVTVRLDLGYGQGGEASGDTYNSIENVEGSAHRDYLHGNGEDNGLWGRGGDDWLYGNGGNDYLIGGDGNDVISGGSGKDVLEGGAGQDILTGGSGGDTFRYESFSDGADWITDFTQSGWRPSGGFPIFLEGDKIDLSAIDARLVTQAGNNSFEFVGNNAFSGDGQVRYYHEDGDTIVEAQSILFQGAEVLTIKLEGLYNLTAADFIL